MKYYRVVNWDENFEVAQSRRIPMNGKHTWLALPNKHDGKGYRRLLKHSNAAEIFTAWIMILQVASKCKTRGVLVDDGEALTAEDLSDKTGWKSDIFDSAFLFLSSEKIKWLEQIDSDQLGVRSEHAPHT